MEMKNSIERSTDVNDIRWNFDQINEEIYFVYLVRSNIFHLLLTSFLYFVSLLLFAKNLFFVFIVVCHLMVTFLWSTIIYFNVLHFPLTILNWSSLSLSLVLIFFDAFLWYTSWFISDHRRDDCTIHRTLENLLTQTFYYLVPKTIVTILILIVTFASRIIALRCFNIFALILIVNSLIVSFIIYPGKTKTMKRKIHFFSVFLTRILAFFSSSSDAFKISLCSFSLM